MPLMFSAYQGTLGVSNKYSQRFNFLGSTILELSIKAQWKKEEINKFSHITLPEKHSLSIFFPCYLYSLFLHLTGGIQYHHWIDLIHW